VTDTTNKAGTTTTGHGSLVLVATPIGNLGDLSTRAVEALQSAALICCEDTRRTGKLLQHAGIRGVRMAVANEHTEYTRIGEVLEVLAGGRDVALVSDAGTPGISDPGERLARAVIDAGYTVSAVPGPAALVMALVVSGFDTTRFVFEGFLPRSGSERTRRLREVATERRTIVLYEAPHRVARTITDLVAHCGSDRRVALARELTKLHEEIWRGTLSDAAKHLADREPRGEYVIVMEAAPLPPDSDDDAITAALVAAIQSGATRKAAVATVTADLGVQKRRVFDIATSLPRHEAPR
jgi:16S rRNA (cytidine1402-2'-O)-methyltransferase